MKKRTLLLVALAVVVYLVFLRKKPSRPMPVGVVVGDVYDVETIA